MKGSKKNVLSFSEKMALAKWLEDNRERLGNRSLKVHNAITEAEVAVGKTVTWPNLVGLAKELAIPINIQKDVRPSAATIANTNMRVLAMALIRVVEELGIDEGDPIFDAVRAIAKGVEKKGN
jgi:hypothetical protein